MTDDLSEIITNDIVWPKDFTEAPVSQKQTERRLKSKAINFKIYLPLSILSFLSIIIVLLTGFTTFKYRRNSIIKAASWKLNLITCIGCVIAYITLFLYGIPVNDILCNIKEWLIIISFTLVFMPLFSKTYRISYIFTGWLDQRKIDDYKLVFFVLICLLFDILLLGIFTLIAPYSIVQINDGDPVKFNAVKEIQYEYNVC